MAKEEKKTDDNDIWRPFANLLGELILKYADKIDDIIGEDDKKEELDEEDR